VEWKDLGRFDTDRHALREDGTRIGEGREPGLHWGEVIQEIRREVGDVYASGIPGEPRWLRAQGGFLFEYAIELMAGGYPLNPAMEVAFKRYMLQARGGILKQVKLVRDGIHMTPDGVWVEEKTLESYKKTGQTMKKASDVQAFTTNFYHWILQEGGYLGALLEEGYDIEKVHWYVLWDRGDYKWNCDSKCPDGCSMDNHAQQVRIYEARFTRQELDEIWARGLRMKMKMENREQLDAAPV